VIALRFHHHRDGDRERVRVFAGPEFDQLALCGELVMPPEYWRALAGQLRYGNQQTYADLVIHPEDTLTVLDSIEANLDRLGGEPT
jgi:hypothetical protein